MNVRHKESKSINLGLLVLQCKYLRLLHLNTGRDGRDGRDEMLQGAKVGGCCYDQKLFNERELRLLTGLSRKRNLAPIQVLLRYLLRMSVLRF